MSERPPAVMAEVAERADLGRYIRGHWDERTFWTNAGYGVTALAFAVALALLCFGARVPSLVPVPLAVLWYVWRRYRTLRSDGT
jgi:hypothetical protein